MMNQNLNEAFSGKPKKPSFRVFAAAGASAVLGAALLLSGCSAGTQTAVPYTVQIQNSDDLNTITVTGREEISVAPDMAELTYSVYSQGNTASECQEANSRDLAAAIETLKGLGVEEASIQTSSYGLNPIRNWNSGEQEITGYEMETIITVSDIPIDQAGTIISQSVAAGVNSIDSLRYFASSYDASYQEALKGAMAMAQEKAEAIAEASGRTLTGVIRVQETGYNPTVRYANAALASGARAETSAAMEEMSVVPGEIDIEASVTVDFGLDG